MSPLPFQKHLWLQATLCLMLSEGFDATPSGYHVGYGTAAQFTREYERLFGAPPMRAIKQLRETVSEGTTDETKAQIQQLLRERISLVVDYLNRIFRYVAPRLIH